MAEDRVQSEERVGFLYEPPVNVSVDGGGQCGAD